MRLLHPSDNPIERPRLIERLERAPLYPLTLIAAPAGSGKTTLLAQWRRRCRHPLAWLSLDEGDRNPQRALVRLASALAHVRPSLTLAPEAPLEDALVGLLNDIALVPGELAIVLDNCHAIEGSPLVEATGQLLDYLPPQVHLILASRCEPPWPLGRLRVRGRLAEVGEAELRFTVEETAALLCTMPGLAAIRGQAAALQARCEGWAMGLRLAARALQRRGSQGDAIAGFSGRHPSLARYFQAQVLAPQPEPVRTFLLQTSVLDYLCAGLCNAVTGRPDGQTMLETLERRNLFVVALDLERRRYRYQALFAEFLRQTLARTRPGLEAELRGRAAAWQNKTQWG
jgi:LuxR family maltose regulon positive regulatory protein